MVDRQSRQVDYEDDYITENTRAAYPLEYIQNYVLRATQGASAVLFLTADAFGVLPPISAHPRPGRLLLPLRLHREARRYRGRHGVGGRGDLLDLLRGALLTHPPTIYSTMLAERMREHDARCYLVNTGWTEWALRDGAV